MSKVILHIDLNYFFVRCEEIKNPSLQGKPVVIGSTGRAGIVSTCSYKAREYGIHSGMPGHEAKKLCPDALFLDHDFEYYQQKSKEFFNFLSQYAKLIEPASIDECFVDITNEISKQNKPLDYIKEIQQKLYKETGLYCSIGIAPTKFLAKMASDMKKPNGITILKKENLKEKLYPLKIENFFGIGKKTAPKLRAMNINTIGDLAEKIDKKDPDLINLLGKFYIVIDQWIHGYGDDTVIVEPFDPKSISHSTTLPRDTNDLEEMKLVIKKLAKNVSNEAKSKNKVGSNIAIILKTNEFKLITRSQQIKPSTNSIEVLEKIGTNLLEKYYDELLQIRLVGIALRNLKDYNEDNLQLSIFDNFDLIEENNKTKILIHELNRKMNGSVFKTAKELLEEKKWN